MIFATTSCAVFGSHARGNIDAISDFDVLVVSPSENIGRIYADKNYPSNDSVSIYTWSRFDRMCAERSLFVQHLKLEAKILRDPNDKLKGVLERFTPYNDYTYDIEKTRKFLNLLSDVPHDQHGLGWATDIVAIVARNVGIARLANEGRYVFSWSDLADELVKVGCIEKNERHLISEMRFLKKQYRSQGKVLVAVEKITELILFAQRLSGVEFTPQITSRGKLDPVDVNEGWNPYSRAKLIERDLFSLRPVVNSNREEFVYLRTELRRGIICPSRYLWQFKNDRSGLSKKFSRLRTIAE